MTIIIAAARHSNRSSHFQAFSLHSEPGLVSPFLGVDHYWMSEPTFPPHPHSGMSAVSYVLLDSETGLANRDSIGTNNLIHPGGLHWAAAGSGIRHEEVPAEPGKTVHGLQIFVELSPEQRNRAPHARSIESRDVPIIQRAGVSIRVPVGSFENVRSPLTPPTAVTLLDISLEPGAELNIPVAAGHVLFAIAISGTFEMAGQGFAREGLRVPVFPAQDTAHHVSIRALHDGAKVVFFSGLQVAMS